MTNLLLQTTPPTPPSVSRVLQQNSSSFLAGIQTLQLDSLSPFPFPPFDSSTPIDIHTDIISTIPLLPYFVCSFSFRLGFPFVSISLVLQLVRSFSKASDILIVADPPPRHYPAVVLWAVRHFFTSEPHNA